MAQVQFDQLTREDGARVFWTYDDVAITVTSLSADCPAGATQPLVVHYSTLGHPVTQTFQPGHTGNLLLAFAPSMTIGTAANGSAALKFSGLDFIGA